MFSADSRSIIFFNKRCGNKSFTNSITLINNGIKVVLQDERLTSVAAKKSLIEQQKKVYKNKGLVDQTAAAILLQQYIDTHYVS